ETAAESGCGERVSHLAYRPEIGCGDGRNSEPQSAGVPMSENISAVREDALIVRAESLAAWREGERFLEQARQQAQTIRSEALVQADVLREQARREGYEDGRRDAMDEAAGLALEIAAERE